MLMIPKVFVSNGRTGVPMKSAPFIEALFISAHPKADKWSQKRTSGPKIGHNYFSDGSQTSFIEDFEVMGQ